MGTKFAAATVPYSELVAEKLSTRYSQITIAINIVNQTKTFYFNNLKKYMYLFSFTVQK